tara:strand:- start:1670 stop:1954 length:285 start_codon:yes stop_codon:yes gene_type:complete
MIECAPIHEETILAENFFENVSVHFLSPLGQNTIALSSRPRIKMCRPTWMSSEDVGGNKTVRGVEKLTGFFLLNKPFKSQAIMTTNHTFNFLLV